MISPKEQDKSFVGSYQQLSELRLAPLMNTIKEKWETILILLTIVSTVIGSMGLFIGPRFDSVENRLGSLENRFGSMENRLGSLEKTVNEQTIAITNLDNKIESLDSKYDNKFDNLANVMIAAHTVGDVTEEKLLEIWKQVKED